MKFEFFVQQTPNLSIKEAEKNLKYIMNLLGLEVDEKNKHKQQFAKYGKDKSVKKVYKFTDLRDEIRNTGICELHEDLDNLDPIFEFQFNPSTNSSGIKIGIEWEGYKTEVQGPCRIGPSEWELSRDIEFYKNESCIEFNSGLEGFEMGARNYRGYLFSSIALIDAYINRHIKYEQSKNYNSEDFEKLVASRKTDVRIELFTKVFCKISFEQLKETREWNDFKKLKKIRNSIVHSTEPYMGISLKDISSNLNLSISGIGGLLKLLQESQNKHTLKFIERIRNSSKIDFQERYSDKNGKTKIKIKRNKICR